VGGWSSSASLRRTAHLQIVDRLLLSGNLGLVVPLASIIRSLACLELLLSLLDRDVLLHERIGGSPAHGRIEVELCDLGGDVAWRGGRARLRVHRRGSRNSDHRMVALRLAIYETHIEVSEPA
jgi:hypothetical protein